MDSTKYRIAFLEIVSWVNIGAEHYYGRIYYRQKFTDVNFIVAQKDLKLLNSKEGLFGFRYKVGMECTQFISKKTLVEWAKKVFNEGFSQCDVLLEGYHITCDPQKMLVGEKPLKAKANIYYRAFEKYNGWGCKEEEQLAVRKLSNDWNKLLCTSFTGD